MSAQLSDYLSITAPSIQGAVAEIRARPDAAELSVRRAAGALARVPAMLGLPPDAVSADLKTIRCAFETTPPAALLVTKSRFATIKCDAMRALRLIGIPILSGRNPTSMPPEWRHLIGDLQKFDRAALLPFIRFCIDREIVPDNVDQSTFDAFLPFLETYSSRANRRKKFLGLCRAWNRCRDKVRGWPSFEVVTDDRRDRYRLAEDVLPPSFNSDVEQWLQTRAEFNLLADDAKSPLRQSTIVSYRCILYSVASAAVRSGADPCGLQGLAGISQPGVLLPALRFLSARAGGVFTFHHHKIVEMIVAIARDYVRVPEEQLQQLITMRDNLRRSLQKAGAWPNGMTEKHRELLRLFENAALVTEYLTLPDRIISRYRRRRRPPTRLEATEIRNSLLVGIAIATALRIQNIASIHLERNIVTRGSGDRKEVYLNFPGTEVKNSVRLEFRLPDWLIGIIDFYVENARPIIAEKGNRFLFPGKVEGHGQRAHLSKSMSELLRTELGISMTAHEFRHVAGFLFLLANPGQYEVVRQLLGHRSISTTMQFYAGMEQSKAIAVYDRFLSERRRQISPIRRNRIGRKVEI